MNVTEGRLSVEKELSNPWLFVRNGHWGDDDDDEFNRFNRHMLSCDEADNITDL